MAAIANMQLGSEAPSGSRAVYSADDDGGGNLEPLLNVTTAFSGTLVLHVSKFSPELVGPSPAQWRPTSPMSTLVLLAGIRRGGGCMQVQVNTDRHIEASVALAERVRATVESTLARFSERITRVEVHLSDENGAVKGGFDMRCMMEARVNTRPPTVVTATAATLDEAIAGASAKLERAIENMLGRLNDR